MAEEQDIQFVDNINFSKGLNTIDDPRFIDNGESPAMINVELTPQGNIRTRYGYEKVATLPASGTIRGCMTYNKTYGSNQGEYLIIFHSDGNAYYITNNNLTPTLIGSYGADNGTTVRGITFKDYAIFSNSSSNNIKKWDVSALTDLDAAAPKGNVFGVYIQRLFIAGDISAPSTLYYCGPDDITDWGTSGGAVTINLGDGTILTGLSANADFLQAYKENSINGMTFVWDSTALEYIPQINTINIASGGAINTGSVASVYGYTFFLSKNGIEKYGPSTAFSNIPFPISLKISPTVNSINLAQKDSMNSIIYNNKYYLSVSSNNSLQNNNILIYDENIQRRFGIDSWTTYGNIPALAFATLKDSKKQPQLYFVSSIDNSIYRFNQSYSDDNNGYLRLWKSKTFQFGTRTFYRWLDIEGYMTQQCEIFVDVNTDGIQETFSITNANLFDQTLGSNGYVGESYVGDNYIGAGYSEGTQIPMYRFKRRILIPSTINTGYNLWFQLRNQIEGHGWLLTRYRLAYSVDPEDPTYLTDYLP